MRYGLGEEQQESGQEKASLSKSWGGDEGCTLPTGGDDSMEKQARLHALSELGESRLLFPRVSQKY